MLVNVSPNDPKIIAVMRLLGINPMVNSVTLEVEFDRAYVKVTEQRVAIAMPHKDWPVEHVNPGEVFVDKFAKDLSKLYISLDDGSTRVSKLDLLRLVDQHTCPDSERTFIEERTKHG